MWHAWIASYRASSTGADFTVPYRFAFTSILVKGQFGRCSRLRTTGNISQTKVHFEMLSPKPRPHIAGKEYKLRLMLRDVHGNPALPGPTVCFYCASILPAEVNEDKEA